MQHHPIFSIRLRELPTEIKLLVTFFLLTLGAGYCISLINLNYQYSMLDGEPGVTPADMKRAFFGDRTNTRLAAKISGGSMEQYLPNPADKNVILNWIQDGANEHNFASVQKIIHRNCVRCHSDDGIMSQRPFMQYSDIMTVVKIDRGEPPSLWARVAHTHIQAIGMILFLLGIIFTFSSISSKIKIITICVPFVVLVLDFASRYLAKYNADFVYVMMGTGAMLGLSIGTMIIVSLWEMWLKKKEQLF